MCSFPNAVTENTWKRTIVGAGIALERCTTTACAPAKLSLAERKNFANYNEQLHQPRMAHRLTPPSPPPGHASHPKHDPAPKLSNLASRWKRESSGQRHDLEAAQEDNRRTPDMKRADDLREDDGSGRSAGVRITRRRTISTKCGGDGPPPRGGSRNWKLESLPVIRAIRWAISFVLVIDSACGLRLTNMTAPSVADTRDDMHLDCHFDMGAELLYAVKWYKDDQEFFRYMPHQQPHTVMFPVAGVHMQPASTKCDETRCKLRLTNLTREHSGGAYRCEVSSEAPAFRLASETHNVTVATLPLDLPRITGLGDAYAMDDMLTLECVSGAADPTPQLTWYINNQPAPADVLGEPFTTQVNEKTPRGDRTEASGGGTADGAYRTSLALAKRTQPLRMRIERRHLLQHQQHAAGTLLIRCVSTMPAMAMLPPQSVGHTIIVRARGAQVNNEKLHWPDYTTAATSAATPTTWTAAALAALHCFGALSTRLSRILAISVLLISYQRASGNY